MRATKVLSMSYTSPPVPLSAYAERGNEVILHCRMATAPVKTGATPANILDLAPAAAKNRLHTWASAQKLPRYRVDQIFPRLWQRPIASWAEATDLPKELREKLELDHPQPRLTLDTQQTSQDGTKKFLWRLP